MDKMNANSIEKWDVQDSDAIVIGTGLGGLATTLKLLNYNKKVVVLDKAPKFGGNSILASSGINGVPTKYQPVLGDSVELFVSDTIKSGNGLSNKDLVELLASNSKDAINWLVDDMNLDLSIVSQLGGHSMPRTHRGQGGPPGYEIMTSLFKKIQNHPNVTILMNSKLTKILMNDDYRSNNDGTLSIKGIEFENSTNNKLYFLKGKNLVLATGGYSADIRSVDSLVRKFRPELINYPLTNSNTTVGDGQKIAERDCNAKLIDMNEIQIHPTGFVKFTPEGFDNRKKILCGEILRGIGGIMISPVTGQRFFNELETRDKLSNAVFQHCKTEKLIQSETQTALSIIVISKDDHEKAQSHIDFYIKSGLLFEGEIQDLQSLVTKINPEITADRLLQTLNKVNAAMESGDSLGRERFGSEFDPSNIIFGVVTPVLHYTMGGIQINKFSNVVTQKDQIINNLYAVGEVGGGLHGHNRLSGSSLLQCVVFGSLVAKHISEVKA